MADPRECPARGEPSAEGLIGAPTLNAVSLDLGLSSEAARTPATITDFISGKQVRATPEEIDAVQVFSRRLVEELGYPKIHIQTRPQRRVRASPSGDATKSRS